MNPLPHFSLDQPLIFCADWTAVLQPSQLSDLVGGRVTGVALCPFSPLQNSTSLMTSHDDLYTAMVTDFTARDPAIYRALGPSKHLRTVQYNSRWLNGQFLLHCCYYFFREGV